MIYTVGEMAQKLGVPASTLRYYDKEGLLPFVERSSGGIRMFRETDFEWLQVIRCMKKAGMSIKDIRQYIELSMQGDDTIDTRLEMFRHQREALTQQIQQLQHTLETVEYKCWFYETAKAAGTVDVPGAMTDADVPEAMEELLGAQVHPFIMEKGPKFHVDLQGIGVKLLQDAGLSAENVIDSGICTMCHSDEFWSHRATHGVRGVQGGMICL